MICLAFGSGSPRNFPVSLIGAPPLANGRRRIQALLCLHWKKTIEADMERRTNSRYSVSVNGARYEDTRLDRCTALDGLARSSANVTHTTTTRYKWPDKQFATHQYRRNLPTGNGCDVLQRGQRPEQRGLRIKYSVAIEYWGRSERRGLE